MGREPDGERIHTLVIGAGSAGLTTSHQLTRHGVDHIVVERSAIAHSWRTKWDSFTLVTPAWASQLAGADSMSDDPDAFLPRDELVAHLEKFAGSFSAPVRTGVDVIGIDRVDGHYLATTSTGPLVCDNVVVATGGFQRPNIPGVAAHISRDVDQLHSSTYRSPEALRDGAVLVVGTAQSGAQIADELIESGRRVFISVSRAGRVPRRYRGSDITRWALALGLMSQTVDQLEDPREKFAPNPHVSGKGGGRTLNVHRFARDGASLVGKIEGADGAILRFAGDLHANLAGADEFASRVRAMADEYIAKNSIDAPASDPADDYDGDDGFGQPLRQEIDLDAEGITTIVWATGYRLDLSWIRLDLLDGDGYPNQRRGVTDHPGLYFVGLPYQHDGTSSLLYGVGADAAHVVDHLVGSSPD